MLRAAMALLSTLQIGARIKESLERSLRQAAVIAIPPPFPIPFPSLFQFDAAEAAAIMAGVLLFVGLTVIAIALSMGRKPKRAPPPRSLRPPIPQPCSTRAWARPCSRLARCPPRHCLHRRRALRPPVALAAPSVGSGAQARRDS